MSIEPVTITILLCTLCCDVLPCSSLYFTVTSGNLSDRRTGKSDRPWPLSQQCIQLYANLCSLPSRLIRLGSPNLNYLIGIGAIILYADTCFFIIPTTNQQVVTALCNLTPWLTALGYSLCYGTILAKMVRVYYIFDNPTPQKKKVGYFIL